MTRQRVTLEGAGPENTREACRKGAEERQVLSFIRVRVERTAVSSTMTSTLGRTDGPAPLVNYDQSMEKLIVRPQQQQQQKIKTSETASGCESRR